MDKPPPEKGEGRKPHPPFLYRYRPLPDKSLPAEEYKKLLEREKRIFTERKLFFSSPAEFNDPFDFCMGMLRFPKSPQDWKKLAPRLLKRKYPGLSRQRRRALQREYEKRQIYENVDTEEMRRQEQEAMNRYGVLCLSEVFDSLLMWSHYTQGHTGYCLWFKRANQLFIEAIHVVYSEEYPQVDVLPDKLVGNLIIPLRTKSSEWRYEMEWRVLWEDGAGKNKQYPEGSLVGVILGCRISREHKRLMLEWTGTMDPRPMIIQARRKPKKYGLDFFLMNPETGKEVPIDLNDLQTI